MFKVKMWIYIRKRESGYTLGDVFMVKNCSFPMAPFSGMIVEDGEVELVVEQVHVTPDSDLIKVFFEDDIDGDRDEQDIIDSVMEYEKDGWIKSCNEHF